MLAVSYQASMQGRLRLWRDVWHGLTHDLTLLGLGPDHEAARIAQARRASS